MAGVAIVATACVALSFLTISDDVSTPAIGVLADSGDDSNVAATAATDVDRFATIPLVAPIVIFSVAVAVALTVDDWCITDTDVGACDAPDTALICADDTCALASASLYVLWPLLPSPAAAKAARSRTRNSYARRRLSRRADFLL